jgi:hypothetical protein
MAGGSKRWRDFPDFQRFGRSQPLSDGFSSHGIFLPRPRTKTLQKLLEKGVVNLYLVFGTDTGH